jgi:riboflavin kinase/FMN adenylyltransferase
MRILTEAEAPAPPGTSGSVVTIGMFDGVHRGHRSVLAQLRAQGDALGLPTIVVTFDPHPRAVVTPQRAPSLLGTLDQRLALLADTGAADACLVVRFDRARSAQPVDDFVDHTLLATLGMRGLVVGENFACGHRRMGDISYLRQAGGHKGFSVHPVALRQASEAGSDVACSSTHVRELVSAGELERAAAVLGRPYALYGTVLEAIGDPVVKLPARMCLPASGDFDGLVVDTSGRRLPAVLQMRDDLCTIRLLSQPSRGFARGNQVQLRFGARRSGPDPGVRIDAALAEMSDRSGALAGQEP